MAKQRMKIKTTVPLKTLLNSRSGCKSTGKETENKFVFASFEFVISDGKSRYILKSYNNNSLWLENGDGEGMELNKVKFLKVLDKYFKENF
jgi:adenine-specific DNA methylase